MDYLTRVGAIIIEDNKLLVVRNNSSPIYLMPGGTVKEKESKLHALERELDEELKVRLESQTEFKTYYADKALFHELPLKFVTYLAKIAGVPIPSHEIIEAAWLTPENFKDYELAPTFKSKVIPDLVSEGRLKSFTL
jgi:8-oxo-dGTP diphosphatase